MSSYRDTMPKTLPPTTPAHAEEIDDVEEWAYALFVSTKGNRREFKREEMCAENKGFVDFVTPMTTPRKPKLRLVDRFWIHSSVSKDDPVWFDDAQIVGEAARLTNFKVTPEEAAKKLGFKAEWYVVEPVTYQNPDGSKFVKYEPVEDDKHQWYPATDEEIAAALAEKGKA